MSVHSSASCDLQIIPPIGFMMKVLIAFLICIVAVFGEISNLSKRVDEMLKDASNACVRELNRDPRFISVKSPPSDPGLVDDPYFVACLDKKMGVMNEDATYNLERILSYSETPEAKQRAESIYNTKIRECTLKVGHDTCRMVACVHKLPEVLCNRTDR